MPSVFTDNLKLELINTGSQAGTWGVTANRNVGTALEEAITGIATVPMPDADVTLLATNVNTTQTFRHLVLNVTGALTANRELIVPTISKPYLVWNNTSGGFAVTVKTAAGTGVAVPAGTRAYLMVDGADVVEAVVYQGGAVVTTGASQTLTNKTLNLTSNTLTGTLAQFNTAVSNATLARTDAGQTFTGTQTFSSTISGSINGNAATATTLQTARNINGTSFNGSANITTANWGTARTISIGGTGKSVNGSGDVTWATSEIAAQSAVQLATARTIGGVSFNGTANINLPGVNTAGNQNTSGNADTATTLQTARNINGTSFNGSANITTANWGTARTLTIGGTGKSVNGSGNVSWSLGEIGVNNSTLTLATSGIATGAQTWTSNQGTNATFTVNVPATNLAMGGSGNSRTITSSTGNNVSVPVATNSNAGFMATGDKTKLDGIAAGAQVNVGTDLGSSGTGGTRTITSSTGSNTSITYTAADVGAVSTSDARLTDARQATNTDTQLRSLGVGVTATGTVGEIRATNNITAFHASDVKHKENIVDIPDPLRAVVHIGGKLFDWKDAYIDAAGGADGYFVSKEDFGVVAQDVQAVFPLAVKQRQDGTLAVDYVKLSALAFAAIKELAAKVETLENK